MLWDRIRPELDDGVDLGLQVNFDKGYVAPTIYYTRFRHRSVSFYDPVVGVPYSQNVGEGHTTGAQVAAAWNPLDSLSLFGSLSYNRAVFDEDVLTAGGATLRVSGQQLPDAPKRMATLGLTWKPGKFSVSPILRYQSERYGDSGHQERVPGFTTVDLQFGYQEKLGWGSLDVSLALLNAFDRKYISLINAGDVQGTGGIGYYPGAPRTLMGKVALSF
jgi:iron complex outermembrane recepter protein